VLACPACKPQQLSPPHLPALRYDYLWKKDPAATLQAFLASEGSQAADGTRDDPPLAKFEAQITKYKQVRGKEGRCMW
jgi:hypothetical protein